MNFFDFDKKTPIILYGAAAIGKIMYEALSEQGFNIAGFIDMRADEMKNYCGFPVWELNSKELNTDWIVVLSVKNVFEHEQIVKKLVKNGFHKLIFKPANVLNNCADQYETLISNIYDDILGLKNITEQKVTQTCNANIYVFEDKAVIHEEGDYVTAHIPNEFVYTNNYSQSESKWGNVNIMAFFTHIQFFRFLLGERDNNPLYYLEEYCVYTAPADMEITDGWKNNVIRNRAMILEQMNYNSEIDPDFFVRNAPEAEWNQNGYFNLTSGKHRAAFSVAKGLKYIAIKVKKQDYDAYLNKINADKLIHYINENDIELDIPISNPMFYNYPMMSNEYYNKMMLFYSDYIMEKEYAKNKTPCLNNISAIEYTDDLWGISGHLSRMGIKAYKAGHNNPELFSVISDLLHTDNLELIDINNFSKFIVNYLIIETDKTADIESILNKTEPEYLIVVCDIESLPEIKGYELDKVGITSYKGKRLIHTVNYKRRDIKIC